MIPFQTVLDEHGPHLYRHLVGVLGPTTGPTPTRRRSSPPLRAWPPNHDGNLRGVAVHASPTARSSTRPGPGGAGRCRSGPSPTPAGGRVRERPERDADGGVWDAVRSLPEKQRIAVALRHADDWGYDDIAAVLDCSEAAARQSVKAGLDRLKEVLGHG